MLPYKEKTGKKNRVDKKLNMMCNKVLILESLMTKKIRSGKKAFRNFFKVLSERLRLKKYFLLNKWLQFFETCCFSLAA